MWNRDPSPRDEPARRMGPGGAALLHVDDAVDRYVVEAAIGAGAMAQVYRVRHRLLGTVHALKVLVSRHPELRERLVQEGRIQAGLGHDNVVPVTDILDVHGHPGLLMDHVDGGGLYGLLAQGPLPLADALAIFDGILAGVGAAHGMGIIHRDLKPANVLLNGQTRVPRVTDFGLARHLQHTDGRQTSVGQVMGTPAYMAPEQARSARQATARSDIFALGAILYEMVCGRPAFSGESLYEILGKIGRGTFSRRGCCAPTCRKRWSGPSWRASRRTRRTGRRRVLACGHCCLPSGRQGRPCCATSTPTS